MAEHLLKPASPQSWKCWSKWKPPGLCLAESLDVALESLDVYRRFPASRRKCSCRTRPKRCRRRPEQKVRAMRWTPSTGRTGSGRRCEKNWPTCGARQPQCIDVHRRSRKTDHEADGNDRLHQQKARITFIASVLRADLQRDFCEKLADSGYELVDCAGWATTGALQQHPYQRHELRRRTPSSSPKPDAGTLSNTSKCISVIRLQAKRGRRRKFEAAADTSQVYDIPAEALGMKCIPHTSWSDNAADEQFDLERVQP